MAQTSRLEGVLNFRDVSSAIGSRTGVAPGRLFRSSYIDKATKSDRQYLQHELGIKTIIYLGGPPQNFVIDPNDPALYKPAYEDGIHHYQVLDLSVHEIAIQSQACRDALKKRWSWMDKTKGFIYAAGGDVKRYRKLLFHNAWKDPSPLHASMEYLDLSKRQIKAIFQALATDDVCPVLICGPSTSFIICLALKLLDVPDESVIHDHALTDQWKDALNEERRAILLKIDINPDEEPDRTQPSAEYVEGLLDHLDGKYKGVEAYLESIGLTSDELDRVKNNLQGTKNRNEKLVDL